jgi:phosphohistidine phosphatase
MTKTLHLLRHAQSADKQQRQSDWERELTTEGTREATAIGNYFKKQKLNPDLVVSSDAARAKMTAIIVAKSIGYSIDKIRWQNDIYAATTETLLTTVRLLGDEFTSVLMVGHNPCLSLFSQFLTSEKTGDLATAGLVTIQFPLPGWRHLTKGSGEFIHCMHPSLLPQVTGD